MRVLHKKQLEKEAAEQLMKDIHELKQKHYIVKGYYPTHVEMTNEEYYLLQLLCFYESPSDTPKKVYDLEIIIKN